MKYYFFLVVVFFLCKLSIAQNDELIIQTDSFAKDDRFNKYHITRELFLVNGDTIKTATFEGLSEAKIITIKKPEGYKLYAYGFIFFAGTENKLNPYYITILVTNYLAKNPKMWIDYNQNFDFTDDPNYSLPYFNEKGTEVFLPNQKNQNGKNKILFTRTSLFGKFEFRKQMNEYYAFFYKDRKFIGIDYTYREQRYLCKSGIVKFGNDSFRIALYDGNRNGLYNDADTDRVIVINYNDSIFDNTNDLFSTKLAKKNETTYFEKNGQVFEILETDEAGNFIKIRPSKSESLFGKIKVGKKIPKFIFTTYKGEKKNIRKYKRQEVFMYFSSATSKNFHSDTAFLRQIAAIDSNKIRVILFLYVNKSFELRYFSSQAKPNYILALGHKNISNKLGIRGLPQTLLVGKKRSVKKYGISPEEYFKNLKSTDQKYSP